MNDAKVTGHTAILPTLQASGETLGQLGDDKRLVLTRVVRRMWEAVADDHVHDVTLVVANIDPDYDESHPNLLRISEADSRFTSCSDQTISLGWKGIEPTKTQEHDGGEDEEDAPAGNLIPVNLATGANAMPMPRSGARLVEGKIKPPKPYTEATLLAAMEHASRLLDDAGLKAALDDDESHSGGIGMPATRADVIEKLIRSAYVERKGKQLRSTEQGRNLINVVALRLKDVALTAEMEQVLSDVEHGNADPTQTESRFRAFAAGIPADAQSTAEPELVQARRSRVTERSARARAAASPSSRPARSGNARPTNERNNRTAHGRMRAAVAGNYSPPSRARPSPTRTRAVSWPTDGSALRDSYRKLAGNSTPCSSSTRKAALGSSSMTNNRGTAMSGQAEYDRGRLCD